MDLKDLIELAWAEAFASKLEGDEAGTYRSICRQYSKIFHTPLHVVENELDPLYVLKSVYEDQIDASKLDNIETVEHMLDMIYTLQDPNYESEKEEELDEFMEDAMMDEKKRVDSGTKLLNHLAKKKKAVPEKEQPAKHKELPKAGGINLAYLADSDNEG